MWLCCFWQEWHGRGCGAAGAGTSLLCFVAYVGAVAASLVDAQRCTGRHVVGTRGGARQWCKLPGTNGPHGAGQGGARWWKAQPGAGLRFGDGQQLSQRLLVDNDVFEHYEATMGWA